MISIAAGVAVVRVLRAAGFDAALKWPNDIWVSGGKAGGILSEIVRDAEGRGSVVVGVGLNVTLPRGPRRRHDERLAHERARGG